MLKKWISLVVISILLCVIGAEAGTKGILTGKVVDSDKKPLYGAKVRVFGTTLGAITKDKGEFVVANIPAGEYVINVTYPNFSDKNTKVEIFVDKSIELNVVMQEKNDSTQEFLETDNKTFDLNKVALDTNLKKGLVTAKKVNSIDAFVSQTAGVVSSGYGFHIIGCPVENTIIRVYDNDIENQFLENYSSASVSEVEKEKNIEFENCNLIYPNPCTNTAELELNLKKNSDVYIEISDFQGNMLISKNLNNVKLGLNNINLDLTTLNSGKYFVTVNVNGKRETKSLTVLK